MTIPREVIWHLDSLIRTDFARLANSYMFWLLACTGLVVLGIMLEGPEVVHDARELAGRHSLASSEKPAWIALLALLGWILVVAGVAGEGVSEGFLYRAEGLLSTFNSTTLQAEQIETAQAEERANQANLRAAETENTTLKLRASLAAEEMAAAEAQKEAAKAELALARLKEPRTLSDTQRAALVSRLKPFAGTQIRVLFDDEDMEAAGLAIQLSLALRKAGWIVEDYPTGNSGYSYQMTKRPGINVGEFAQLKLPSGAPIHYAYAKAAAALSKALLELGLLNAGPGQLDQVTDDPRAKVLMVVGRKL